MPVGFRVRVPATSANLGPGFDCLGMSLRLHNCVQAEICGHSGVRIEITGEGADTLPHDESNLVFQTMLTFSQRIGRPLPGLFLKIHNEIPSTRGLGSSATAIVAGLVLANEILESGMSREQLLQIATEMEGHPDNVAPALLGGVVVAGYSSENEIIFKRFTLPPAVQAVVAIPSYEVSTEKSRAALPSVIPRQDAVYNVCQVGMMMASLAAGDFTTFSKFANDKLHEPYRLPLMPGTKQAIKLAKEAGAGCVTLSGSGPTLLALCDPTSQNNDRDLSKTLSQVFRDTFANESVETTVLTIDPDIDGATIEKL